MIDEVRYSRINRSTNWVWAEYQTMASNTVFNSYGTVVSSDAPIANNSIGATGVTANAAWLNGVLVSTGASQTVWGLLWGTNNPGATMDGWLGGGTTDLGQATSAPITNTMQITGLRDGRTYYYTYWATNASGANVASPTSFTTAIVSKTGPFKMPISFPGYTNRTEALANFPALVAFSNGMGNADFHFQRYPFLSANGWDLRFRDAADTTNLNYEIES